MPDPLAHVYDLALRALAEQERQVAALHGRLAPVLAAGGLAATLLAPPAFRGRHTSGLLAIAALALAALGIVVAIVAAVRVLIAPRLAFGVDASSANAILRAHPATDERRFYVSMTALLDRRRAENAPVLDGLQAAFTWMVCGTLVGVGGLALKAAIA